VVAGGLELGAGARFFGAGAGLGTGFGAGAGVGAGSGVGTKVVVVADSVVVSVRFARAGCEATASRIPKPALKMTPIASSAR
jgi:hypothetical protein